MPVTTRARANQIQEDEFAILRKIETDYVNEHSIIITTRSATGLGTHRRWVYSDTMLPAVPNTNSGLVLQNHEPPKGRHSEPQIVQDKNVPPHSSRPCMDGLEDDECRSPGSSPPVTPSPPKPISRRRVLADTDMKFLLHIKKDENVEEAVSRHIELYVKESENRKHQNQRRVYEFIKTQPHFLQEIDEDTEVFVREGSSWDRDPFQ